MRDGSRGDHRFKDMERTKRIVVRGIALLVTGALSLWSGFAHAHDRPHAPAVFAEIDSATVEAHAVDIILSLTGLDTGHAVAVHAVSAEGASTARMTQPVPVPFAEDVTLTARLHFVTAPPGIFTLTLDFGAAGQGGVIVIPEAVATNAQGARK